MVLKRKTGYKISSLRKKVLKKRAKKITTKLKAPINTYHDIEKKIDQTWKKLRRDVKKGSLRAIAQGRSDLLMLLGECNYMAHECAHCMKKRTKR